MPNELYLIGTVHNDPDGKDRLCKLLNLSSPSLVAVESHKDCIAPELSVDDYLAIYREVTEEAGIHLTDRQATTFRQATKHEMEWHAFELQAAKEYTQSNPNSKLRYIDEIIPGSQDQKNLLALQRCAVQQLVSDDEFVRLWLSDLDEGLEACLRRTREGIDFVYTNYNLLTNYASEVRSFLEHTEEMPSALKEVAEIFKTAYSWERENRMGQRIRELYPSSNRL